MPKRLCPFEDNLMPQIKMYVTEKEYNLNTGKGMNIVYDKTTSLLFNGMKKLYDTKIKPEKMNSDMPTLIEPDKKILCAVCKVLNKNQVSKCWYCDKELCTSCLGSCINCKELHCRNCSVISYEENFLGLICLSCYNN